MNQWLWAATALIGLQLPLLLYATVAPRLDALVALEACGALTTLALVALAQGFERTAYTIVAVVSSVVTIAGSLVFVRFFERELDP
jgi:multisubunit Na+/H+ antiporter MnhF subunit